MRQNKGVHRSERWYGCLQWIIDIARSVIVVVHQDSRTRTQCNGTRTRTRTRRDRDGSMNDWTFIDCRLITSRILKVQTIFANDQGKWLSQRHGAHKVNDRPSPCALGLCENIDRAMLWSGPDGAKFRRIKEAPPRHQADRKFT